MNTVKEWLIENGIAEERITLAKGRNWYKFEATVEEAEALLKTEYGIYTDSKTGKDHLACEEYSVPHHIQEHIDFIKPTVHFDAYVKPKKQRRSLPESAKRDLDERNVLKVKPFPIAVTPGPEVAPTPQTSYSLANCYEYITPDCLRALYGLPNGTLAK
jgi:tripeptidyl-peptidase-1